MGPQIYPQKSRKKVYITIIVILSLALLGAVGYIVWDKTSSQKESYQRMDTEGKSKKVTKADPVTKKHNKSDEPKNDTKTTAAGSITIKEWDRTLVLNDQVNQKDVSYQYELGSSAIDSRESSIIVTNTQDPLVKICGTHTITIARASQDQASYVAPGTVAMSDADSNYGAQYVIDDWYYFISGPNGACNGDYSMLEDPQHAIVESFQ